MKRLYLGRGWVLYRRELRSSYLSTKRPPLAYRNYLGVPGYVPVQDFLSDIKVMNGGT